TIKALRQLRSHCRAPRLPGRETRYVRSCTSIVRVIPSPENQVQCPYGQKTRTRLDRGSYDPAIAAPRLDFSCAMPHIYRQCARKRWRGTDAWIGRPCWCSSQGRSIKSCCYATSIWSRKIVSSASSSKGASG